jgi:hypothetical protein
LALLARRWDSVRAGDGQLVMIVGEPGLGKSRLIEEFHARLAETPHTWVEWSASQLLQNTPLHPIAEWGRLRFGPDASVEQRLADLAGKLRLIGLDPVEYTPLLAPLVDIPLPSARAAKLPPEELRRRQLAAMTAWVLAGARSQPAVVAFEDLHAIHGKLVLARESGVLDGVPGGQERVAAHHFERGRAQFYEGIFFEGWTTADARASGAGLKGMRGGVELLRQQNVLVFDGLLKTALAEAEARRREDGMSFDGTLC